MSYNSVKNSISEQERANDNGRASPQLKLYQAFIFSVPIFFTFVLLILFYLFYLRRRRVDWSSLRMRTSNSMISTDDISRCELGLKKELREMLPIVVFKESFFVKDTLCSVCLGEYEAEDKLQQIPGCGHTFHMDCIDLWLSTHTTCPLCRQSLLLASTNKVPPDDAHLHTDNTLTTFDVENGDETSRVTNNEDPQTSQPPLDRRDDRAVPTVSERERHVVVVQYDDDDDDAK
ncbi:RING-H2 finger protein atl7 [Phtheirospermum japonicum]|uniref:RING-type E3 ubiquitin transferase n=1 Tax=Phtheirospermum japonicum TaxID=374723 RepID=A0A830D5A8_9LAMI|nr:RING-H2 finger protein atl7 [Phtheirospermum japonicum]